VSFDIEQRTSLLQVWEYAWMLAGQEEREVMMLYRRNWLSDAT
jgi:hypothetical protein